MLNEDELGDFFSKCGEIESVRMIYNSRMGHFKGFAYIDFVDVEGVKKALKLQGQIFMGRPLYIDLSQRGPKHGFHLNKPNSNNQKYNQKFFPNDFV